jgi:Domain of unknown function (DUF4263)
VQILVVHKHPFLEDILRNSLAPIAERDSIHFLHTYESAETFIQNNIVAQRRPLDLIICENNIGSLSAVDFFNRITKDRERTFSNGHFYFHTIPVVLIVDEWENRHAFLRHGFAEVLDDIALENLYLYSFELASVIKQWRRRMIGDLSNIGIPYERGRLLYQYTLSEKKREGIYTSILSDDFKKKPTALLYDWIATSERQLEVAIGKLEKELKRSVRLETREEKRVSDLLEQNQFLIKRDNYSYRWHEPRLRRQGRRSYRLDFTLKPNFNQLADMSVLELKLPNDQLIVSPNFHPTFSSRLIRGLSQVNDYRRYISDAKNRKGVWDAFQFIPEKVDYTILVGRQEEKERHQETFNQRNQEFNAGRANITTYDEFVQMGINYLGRRDLLSIL